MSSPDSAPSHHNDSPSLWFFVVGGVALFWNLLGLLMFGFQLTMTPEALEGLPEAEQELYRNIPIWVTIAFGLAVVGGTLGSIGLVLRKAWCVPVLVVSLVGVLIQNVYVFFLSNTIEVMGDEALIMPIVIILIAVFLVLFTSWAQSRGWLK